MYDIDFFVWECTICSEFVVITSVHDCSVVDLVVAKAIQTHNHTHTHTYKQPSHTIQEIVLDKTPKKIKLKCLNQSSSINILFNFLFFVEFPNYYSICRGRRV